MNVPYYDFFKKDEPELEYLPYGVAPKEVEQCYFVKFNLNIDANYKELILFFKHRYDMQLLIARNLIKNKKDNSGECVFAFSYLNEWLFFIEEITKYFSPDVSWKVSCNDEYKGNKKSSFNYQEAYIVGRD